MPVSQFAQPSTRKRLGWALAIALMIAAPSVHAQETGARSRVAKPALSTPAGTVREPGSSAAEEVRYRLRVDRLRNRIVARSHFVAFDQPMCTPGSLRMLTADSVTADSAATVDVEELERLVISRGIDSSLSTPSAQDLIRTVILWEAGAKRPLWDVKSGKAPQAIATGLSGEFFNPATKKCESYTPIDSVTVVIPEIEHFVSPKSSKIAMTIVQGEDGLKKQRDAFYIRSQKTGDTIFNYIRIRGAVVWGDYAVVAVNRPAENKGVQQLRQGAGGAAYIFHRVGREWRLLTITRTWT